MLYKGTEVRLEKSTYKSNDTLAVVMFEEATGEEYGVITVNIDGYDCLCDDTRAFLDTNNFPEIREFLEDNNLATYVGCDGLSGFCTYPLYQFDVTKIPDMK